MARLRANGRGDELRIKHCVGGLTSRATLGVYMGLMGTVGLDKKPILWRADGRGDESRIKYCVGGSTSRTTLGVYMGLMGTVGLV